MLRKFMVRLVLSLAIIFCVCGAASAKSGQEHIHLWDDIFGVTGITSRENIRLLWSAAQKVIDDIGSDYRYFTGASTLVLKYIRS